MSKNVMSIDEFIEHLKIDRKKFYGLWGLKVENHSTWKGYIVVGNDDIGWSIYSKRRDVPQLTDI